MSWSEIQEEQSRRYFEDPEYWDYLHSNKEKTMKCDKCGSTAHLSIKARKRNGEVRAYRCRACRRAEYRRDKEDRIYAN